MSIKESQRDHASEWDKSTRIEWDDPDQLHKAFLGLSSDQRIVIYLKIVKGFSNHEVSDTLARSIGAVKALQNQGLKNLLHLLYSEQDYKTV